MKEKSGLVGKTIGNWFVAEKIGVLPKRGNHIYYRCVCKCGSKTNLPQTNLTRGVSKSCRKCANTARRGTGKIRLAPVFSRVKKGAESRGIEFSITHNYALDVMNLQGWKCALTNIPLYVRWNEKYSCDSNASLDRIDSTRGYVKGNIQWVYMPINLMKWKLDQKEFIRLCRLVTETASLRG